MLTRMILAVVCSCCLMSCNKNGWDQDRLERRLRGACTQSFQAAYGQKLDELLEKETKSELVGQCVKATIEASRPCQIEYQFGSDSAEKCLSVRVGAELISFLEVVKLTGLFPEDVKHTIP